MYGVGIIDVGVNDPGSSDDVVGFGIFWPANSI